MPWKECSMEKSRMDFIKEASSTDNFSKLCRKYEISRKTGYKWIERYNEGESLRDKNKRPFKSPNKIDSKIEELIVTTRDKYPYWGGRKLKKILEKQGYTNLPSVSTFANVLKRNKKIDKAESIKHIAFKRYEKKSPNIMWQMDFKGQIKLKNSTEYCYPLTIKDDKSRYCITVKACKNIKYETVKEALIEAFREYGMPKSILSDNGKPWGDSKNNVITKMDIWFMDLDIKPIHIRPKHPQTQGKIESLNKALKNELLKYKELDNFENAQVLFNEWKEQYNNIRPHESLNFETPSMHYNKSNRIYKEIIEEYKYSDNVLVVKIDHLGFININKRLHFLGEALRGKYVGLVKSNSYPNITYLQYRNFIIAAYDSKNNEFNKIGIRKIER